VATFSRATGGDGRASCACARASKVQIKTAPDYHAVGGVMNFTAVFIRRPVMTTLVMAGIVIFGLVAYRQLR